MHLIRGVENMLVESITDLQIFSQVVKEGSLSAAGRALGVSSAVVSKRLQRLEEQLGARLVNRSTRRLGVTEAGAKYYEYCVRALAELEEAEALITHGNGLPKGTLRVTVPAAFGRLHIAPLVPGFLARYPDLRLSLHLSDSTVDVIDAGYDLAVRIGDRKDSSLVARHLGVDRRLVVATPAYLERWGEPRTPAELAQHNALLFSNPSPLDRWPFIDREGNRHEVKVYGNFETNTCEALREALLAGVGLALRPTWDVGKDIQSGALKVLLPDYTQPSFTIQAVYPSRRHLSQKVRVFIDTLREAIGDPPYWDLRPPGGVATA